MNILGISGGPDPAYPTEDPLLDVQMHYPWHYWHDSAGQKHLYRSKRAPGNDAPIGGLKVVSVNGWFAARPSGTENIYKLYAESLRSAEHLAAIVKQAQEIVSRSLSGK